MVSADDSYLLTPPMVAVFVRPRIVYLHDLLLLSFLFFSVPCLCFVCVKNTIIAQQSAPPGYCMPDLCANATQGDNNWKTMVSGTVFFFNLCRQKHMPFCPLGPPATAGGGADRCTKVVFLMHIFCCVCLGWGHSCFTCDKDL